MRVHSCKTYGYICANMATARGNASTIKVLGLVSYNFLPAKMGGQKGIGCFYDFYSKWVTLICVTTKSNDPSAASYQVLNILSNSVLRYINVFYFFTLRRIIKKHGITHLQIEHPYYGWLALLIRSFCGVKLILHSHNIEGERFRSMSKWWAGLLLNYERFIHRGCDFIFFVAEEDREYSINKFNVDPRKCLTTPYGIEWSEAPADEDKQVAKNWLQARHAIKSDEKIFLLNGSFNHKPNFDALIFVVEKLNTVLLGREDIKYRIIICGKGIPGNLRSANFPNVDIVGFVDDISVYFKGCDVFFNPLSTGGGIKTKLVEALGYNLYVVSLHNGALGVPLSVTGDKLVIINDDNDIAGFADAVIACSKKNNDIPADYFKYFYWGDITKNAVELLSMGI